MSLLEMLKEFPRIACWVQGSEEIEGAISVFKHFTPKCCTVDLSLGPEMERDLDRIFGRQLSNTIGFKFVEQIVETDPLIISIIVSGFHKHETERLSEFAQRASELGCFFYVQKDSEDYERLPHLVGEAIETYELLADRLREPLGDGVNIAKRLLLPSLSPEQREAERKEVERRVKRLDLGGMIYELEDSKIQSLLETVARIANSRTNVLILGETGTGKNRVARIIHENSKRRNERFMEVVISGLSKELLESELFGHEKSAFTGANQMKQGRLEEADRGTVFIDEVGDIPCDTQVKLLRFLEDREFERIGSTKKLKTDVRLIFATNKDLGELVKEGQMRPDFYHRIQGVTVRFPPLRECRKAWIVKLVKFFMETYKEKHKKDEVEGITPNAMKSLLEHDWPGNIRELEHNIDGAVALTLSRVIDDDHLSISREMKAKQEKPYPDIEEIDSFFSEACQVFNTDSESAVRRWKRIIEEKHNIVLTRWRECLTLNIEKLNPWQYCRRIIGGERLSPPNIRKKVESKITGIPDRVKKEYADRFAEAVVLYAIIALQPKSLRDVDEKLGQYFGYPSGSHGLTKWLGYSQDYIQELVY